VRIVGGLEGSTVAVLGAGSIGLLTMLAARDAGAAAIAVTDPVPAKRALALGLGADLAVDPMEGDAVDRIRAELPWRPDVVFDCVASQGSTDQAIALALKGGTIVVEGVPRDPVQVPLPLVQDRELRIQGTAMYIREDVERAIALIGNGAVPAGRLVTAEFPLDRVADAFAAARTGAEIKVHVKPQQ
jgi:threonine dehydrogenase-like Zn-dependent dehydrogenase